MRRRATKIVATLGPATDGEGTLDALVAAGVDCVRINCSHGTHEELRARTQAARAAAARARRPLGVLFDLQGPKLRLSAGTAETHVGRGETVTFRGARGDGDPGRADPGQRPAGEGTGADGPASARGLVVEHPDFVALVTDRSQIVIGDGLPRFAVERIAEDHVVARATSAGSLSGRKGVNVTYARPNLPALTEKDLADLALAVELDADAVALSFVRSARDVEDLVARLREHGSDARAVAKIEKVEAFGALEEILAVADGVMVARGDYGVEAGVAHVPLMQKETIRAATAAGKLVITATQMLESMLRAAEPTRAEAADVANAVIDGTSAVMLSGETAVGEHPVAAVAAMAEIAEAAEAAPSIHGRARGADADGAPAGMVLFAAVQLAESLDARALVIPTATGGGARACAKYRPRRPVLALCHEERVAAQLTLEWGVHPIGTIVAGTTDELVETCLRRARDEGGVPRGATVVLTAGLRTGTPGATSLVMVREVP